MRRVVVIGKTDVVINLNKIGVPIRGKSTAILNLVNDEQERELMGVICAGLLEIIEDSNKVTPIAEEVVYPENTENTSDDTGIAEETTIIKSKYKGRPKGAKNKATLKAENKKNILSLEAEESKRMATAEDKTQKMGSRVVIGGIGGIKEGKMTYSAANDSIESEKTRESIEALDKIEKEERKSHFAIDENIFDISDQMGRKATISTESGIDKVNMASKSGEKEVNPFIDKKAEDKASESFIEKEEDGTSDSFIEI